MLDYIHKMSERQFKGCTGYSRAEFAKLLEDFTKTFEEEYKVSYKRYITEYLNETIQVKLPDLFTCLFFVLYKYKTDLTYDAYGLVFSMAGSTACENFKRYSLLLEKTLKKRANLP